MPLGSRELLNCVCVTALAYAHIVPRGFFAPKSVVGIVTRCASHCTAALLKTRRLAKSVSLIDNFETFFMFAFRRAIEMNGIICERLAWTVGEYAATEAPHGIRKSRAGGFKMALHADFEIPSG